MALTPNCWGYNCEIVKCLKGKGLEFCYECSHYEDKSCETFEKLARGYLENGEDIRANLERIRAGEVEEWLRESRGKYRCPVCGNPLPVYGTEGKCYHCGAAIAQKF